MDVSQNPRSIGEKSEREKITREKNIQGKKVCEKIHEKKEPDPSLS